MISTSCHFSGCEVLRSKGRMNAYRRVANLLKVLSGAIASHLYNGVKTEDEVSTHMGRSDTAAT